MSYLYFSLADGRPHSCKEFEKHTTCNVWNCLSVLLASLPSSVACNVLFLVVILAPLCPNMRWCVGTKLGATIAELPEAGCSCPPVLIYQATAKL